MKRPKTIWLTQSLLIIFALLFLSVILVNLVVLLSHLEQPFSLIGVVISYSVILSIELLFAVAFWGLAKRAAYGRWLALLSLILLWGLIILTTVRRPSGPFKYYEYDNTAQLAGAVIVQVLVHGLFLTLILRLSLSKKVKEFFAKGEVT